MQSDTPRVDLDAGSRRALEFDELLAWVATFARTAGGARRVVEHAPLADEQAIRAEHEAVEQLMRFIDAEGSVVPPRLPDPREALEALALEGVRLQAKTLHDLARVASQAEALARRLAALSEARFPRLRELGTSCPTLGALPREVLEGIDAEGHVLDSASPELARIRRSARRLAERLRSLLERRLREPGSAAVIRDDFVTQRNGRFVIPVRIDAPHAVRGIVHASSSSGATRFVEPLETVELNNDLVRLGEQEQEEQQRLLEAWTEAWRAALPAAAAAIGGLERVDELQARSLFAQANDAVRPDVEAGAALRLIGARHALLERRLREQGGVCEPLDLMLEPPHQVLVISGPNTGGKTVALKTIALAVLLAQSGIPVPAREVRLPLYRRLRADIGDHQSIEADLSTYSAHVQAIAGFLGESAEPALLLFDELGTGTEPGEGAALARAILETLVDRRVTAVATTHLGALKTWAVGRAEVGSAAMEFDERSLRPTYRLIAGAAGVSAGLQIAQRLGVPASVMGRARELIDPEAREAERHLRRMRELIAASERELQALQHERSRLADERLELREEAERRAVALERETEQRLERALGEIDDRAQKELGALDDARQRARLERRWTRSRSRLRAVGRGVTGALPSQSAGEPIPADQRLEPGERVYVTSLGRDGEVVESRGDRVTVRLGSVQMEVPRGALAASSGAAAAAPGRRPPSVSERRPTLDDGGPGRELHLLGRSVDVALAALDKFLDAAVVAGHDEVRIVHGHGTGRLRSAVRRFLDSHPQVAQHRAGQDHEGGNGATVVRLA